MFDNPFRISNREVWGYPKNPDSSFEEYNYFFNFYTKLVNLALSRFKYEGLPEEIPPLAIEKYLLFNGACLFMREDVIDMFGVTGVSLTGNIDIYGVPMQRMAFGWDGYNKIFGKDDSVVIFSRPFLVPEINQIVTHCNNLATAKVSQTVNLVQQRTPVLLSGDKTTSLTRDNFIQKILKGIPFIKVDSKFRENIGIDVADLRVNPQYNEISTYIQRELAEALAELGIECSGVEKPERLVSTETSYNNGEIEMTRKSLLYTRQRAVDAINRKWGLNISVTFNSEMVTPINRPDAFEPGAGKPQEGAEGNEPQDEEVEE